VCSKNKEKCGPACGCAAAGQCVNQAKPSPGYPLPGWDYQPITFNAEIDPYPDRIKCEFSEQCDTIDVMEAFLRPELFDHFKEMTFQKATSNNLNTYPKEKSDFWRYFLVSLGMGLVKFPKVDHHWAKNNDIYQSEMFSRFLSKRTYDNYRKAINFDIPYVEDYLNFVYQDNYEADCVVVIDECLVLFKGRFAGRQHIRGKPHATGLKFFMCCDKSGYCCSFWLYRGKNFNSKHSAKQKDIVVDFTNAILNPPKAPVPPTRVSEDLETAECQLEHEVDDNGDCIHEDGEPPPQIPEVPAQVHVVGNRELLVIADSYFGSLSCAAELIQLDGIFFVLAARKNIDTEVKSKLLAKLKKGTWRSIYNKEMNVTYCVFNDRAICTFLSNFRSGATKIGEIPTIVWVYNQYMNAVDLFDSILHLHYNTHRNQKWTYCLLYVWLKMTAVNAWIIYCRVKNVQLSHTDFIEQLLRDGLKRFGIKPLADGTPKSWHLLTPQSTASNCVYCYQTHMKRSNTTFYCSTCNKSLHAQCFELYHQDLHNQKKSSVQ